LALRAEVAPEVPETVVGDAERLRQVLANLIGNATKFTDHGEVSVEVGIVNRPPRAASQSDVQAGTTLRLCVRDTGPGIAAENRARIFEPFSQAHTESKHDFGGVGLGLAICARLVHLMGGEIGVESEPGHGSTFHFTARFGRS
jgi:signal transduction histidine kinase